MQKKSHNFRSLQDKKKQCQKNAGTCAEEMECVRQDIEEREARFQELERKIKKLTRAEEDLDEVIRVVQAGEDRRGSCASQSNGCGTVVVEQLFTLGAAQALQPIQALQEEFNRRFDGLHQVPATLLHVSGSEEGGEENDEEQQAATRQMNQPAPGGRNQGFLAGSFL